MRQLTQLEMVVGAGRDARERYRLLARAGCLTPRARLQRKRVLGILDVWPPEYRWAGGPSGFVGPDGVPVPGGPSVDQPPVEGDIVRELARGGYLSRRARELDARFPGDWDAALRLRAPLWRRMLPGRRRPPAPHA
jgi:hypothetical protein